MQPSGTLGDAYRVLRLLLVVWVPFALVGTIMAVLLVFPAFRTDLTPLERADFVADHAGRVRLGAILFALRGAGEVFACFGVIAFVRRLPYQPGLIAATIAVCAAIAALSVDTSGAYLFGRVLPAQAAIASEQGGSVDVPDMGEGLLGALAQLFERMIGQGRQDALVAYVRVEALSLRRVGAYGSALHIVVAIALYAAVVSFDRARAARSLTAATFVSVVVRAVAAGAFYASVADPSGAYPFLALGGIALCSASVVDVWLASAIGKRAEVVRAALSSPDPAPG